MLKNDVIIDKICRLFQFQTGAESAEQILLEQPPTTLEGLSATHLFNLKLRLVMWAPRQPISMFGILNPSLCGRACIWWSNVTPNLFANVKNIYLTSPDCQQNKVSFLFWFGNAILILMHENTAKVDFESSLQHTVGIMLLLMLILVVVCIDILVSIFLLYVIWFSDRQFMKGIYFRGRNI